MGDVRVSKQFGLSSGFRAATDTADQGIYRLRSVGEVPWNARYGHRTSIADRLLGALVGVARLIVPVLALMAAVAGIYLYRDTPVPLFLDGAKVPWLTAADLIVPAAFFIIFLTNRRYGPAYAFAQVVVAGLVIAALVLYGRDFALTVLRQDTIPALRDALAFAAAFFAASFVSIVAFDGARGAMWWTAPLFGTLGAALVFPLAFFPLAALGAETPWLQHALEYMAVIAGEGILFLVPFYLMRRVVPPVSGFGGF